MTLTPFMKWFKAQFGKLPYECRPRNEVEMDIRRKQADLEDLLQELREIEDLNQKFTVANYTKNAATTNFEY